jgi:hypothetical protein
MGAIKNAHKIVAAKLEGKNHSQDPDVDGMIILKWIVGR